MQQLLLSRQITFGGRQSCAVNTADVGRHWRQSDRQFYVFHDLMYRMLLSLTNTARNTLGREYKYSIDF